MLSKLERFVCIEHPQRSLEIMFEIKSLVAFCVSACHTPNHVCVPPNFHSSCGDAGSAGCCFVVLVVAVAVAVVVVVVVVVASLGGLFTVEHKIRLEGIHQHV